MTRSNTRPVRSIKPQMLGDLKPDGKIRQGYIPSYSSRVLCALFEETPLSLPLVDFFVNLELPGEEAFSSRYLRTHQAAKNAKTADLFNLADALTEGSKGFDCS